MSMLQVAIDRLIEFRRSWNEEDVVDDHSGLTALDLDLILTRIGEPETPVRFNIGD